MIRRLLAYAVKSGETKDMRMLDHRMRFHSSTQPHSVRVNKDDAESSITTFECIIEGENGFRDS